MTDDDHDSDIHRRARALIDNPDLHDPEALKHLLNDLNTAVCRQRSLTARAEGMLSTAKGLLTRHAADCPVAAGILHGITIAEKVETYTAEFAEHDGGWFTRMRSDVSDNILIGPLGPFETREEAERAMSASLGNLEKIRAAMPDADVVHLNSTKDLPTFIADLLGLDPAEVARRYAKSGTMH